MTAAPPDLQTNGPSSRSAIPIREVVTPAETSCPICGGTTWKRDSVATAILGLPERYSVMTCKACGQRRLNPRLREAELNDVYSGAYFSLDQEMPESLPALAPPTATALRVFIDRRSKFAATVRDFRKMRPQARTVLDVGAATGEFVKIAREHGFQVDGTEFSSYAVERAKAAYGICLLQLTLEDIRKNEVYDIIHLNHVFEHFAEPATELMHIRRLLSTDGIIYIEIPYQFHPVEKMLFTLQRKRTEFSLTSLHHPYFYSPSTMLQLLKTHGFDVLRMSVFSPDRYQADTAIAKCKKATWWCLSKIGIGNHIEIVARRSS